MRRDMLRLAEARIIVDHALRHARDHGFPPMTVAVLDGGGN
ncbi:hypothetical protein ACFQYP_53355 [Nonomuraea antimicrobica]